MPSLLNILLLSGILLLDKVLALPDPAISPTNPRNYNSLQSLTKPTQINALEDIQQQQQDHPTETTLDVKMTIEQVQKMLERDPTLPRLTRGEIEDLFEQVTKEEYEKSVKAGDYTRAKHMRALMLVLPFNTDSLSNDSLQELYNRPPVTKIVSSSEPKPPKIQKTIVPPSGKVEIVAVDNVAPTTYKPAFRRKVLRKKPIPTTYRPSLEMMKTSTSTTTTTTTTITPSPKEIKFPQLTTPAPFQKVPGKLPNSRYSSHYNAKKADFTKSSFAHKRGTTKFISNNSEWEIIKHPSGTTTTTTTTTTTSTTSKPKITPELEDILESLGFAAKSQSKKRFKLEDPTDEGPLPVISSLIKQDPLSVEEFKPLPINLSADDFKKSLIPQTKPDDFVAFKPLPIPDDTPKGLKPELENYFKMFGLLPISGNGNGNGNGNSRSQKSLKESSNKKSNADIVPKSKSKSKALTTEPTPISSEPIIKRIDTNIDDSVTSNNNHQQRSDEEDYIQLLKLLKNIRELQELNISLTEDKLKKLDVNNYNLSTSLLSQVGPDPLKESDFSHALKNEIKRQNTENNITQEVNNEPIKISLELDLQDDEEINNATVSVTDTSNTTTTTAATTAATTSTTSTTTAATARSDSDGNLSDSFAGGLDPITEEPLPQPRRNGFYFLADWNSFLEVGDGDDQVVVRFSPRAGDGSRFIPVNIP